MAGGVAGHRTLRPCQKSTGGDARRARRALRPSSGRRYRRSRVRRRVPRTRRPRKGRSCADMLPAPCCWPSASRRRRRCSAATSRCAARSWSMRRLLRHAVSRSTLAPATSGSMVRGFRAVADGSGAMVTGCVPGPATSMYRAAGSAAAGDGTGSSRAGRRALTRVPAASWTRATSCATATLATATAATATCVPDRCIGIRAREMGGRIVLARSGGTRFEPRKGVG